MQAGSVGYFYWKLCLQLLRGEIFSMSSLSMLLAAVVGTYFLCSVL